MNLSLSIIQRFLIPALLCLSSTALATVPVADVPNPANTNGSLLAIWTQFVSAPPSPSGIPAIEARFILMGQNANCQAVTVTGIKNGASAKSRGTLQGSFRQQIPGSNPPAYKRGAAYSVTVCSAALADTAKQVSLTDSSGNPLTVYPDNLPATLPGPARLGYADGSGETISAVIMGDSGCRGKTGSFGSRYYQDCSLTDASSDKPYSWPYKAFADQASTLEPDLVFHTGDYHYFWEDDSFWTGSDGQDRFEYWLQEMLIPTQSLLRTAPWVFSRGNHERCTPASWFGDGWHTMFGPTNATCTNPVIPAWYIDVAPGDGNTPPYRFIMIDTSNTQLVGNGFTDAAQQSKAAIDGSSWITHYPPLKLVYYSSAPHFGDKYVLKAINDALSSACTDPSCRPEATFTGHQHLYQQLELNDNNGDLLTKVIIVGHSGTALDQSKLPVGEAQGRFRDSVICQQTIPIETFGETGVSSTIKSANRHGFLLLKRGTGISNDTGLGWQQQTFWAGATPPNFATLTNGSCLNPD